MSFALDVVELGKASTKRIGYTARANNRAEEEAHDIADEEQTGPCREGEVPGFGRGRSVVDDFVYSRREWEVKSSHIRKGGHRPGHRSYVRGNKSLVGNHCVEIGAGTFPAHPSALAHILRH